MNFIKKSVVFILLIFIQLLIFSSDSTGKELQYKEFENSRKVIDYIEVHK
ncbi:MAG: hypothetical protein JXB50_05700 [Spirochaetes bacterium]|nr:hypothetical protein [Spirochaetota bacterium]